EGCFYEKRGVDKEEGGIIIVRPDQYVAEILPLHDYQGVTSFFEKVLIEAM
ncbi:MAG: phenol 2-monooxygenase, partial [Marinomonas primoryensis]